MKKKYPVVLAIFFLMLLSSCSHVPKKSGITTGTFSATLTTHTFQGFFMVSPSEMVIDIVNPLGLTSCRVIIKSKSVKLLNYGPENNTNLHGKQFAMYKMELMFIQRHFAELCHLKRLPNNMHITCTKVGSSLLPHRIRIKSKEGTLSITINNLRIATGLNPSPK